MRNKAGFFLLIFSLSFGLTLAWILGAQTSSGVAASPNAELHVCPSGCAYDSVQDAVDAAKDGDVIKVAEGTYTGVSAREGITQMVYISEAITIQGGYTTTDWDNPEPEVNITTLDAQGQGRVLYCNLGWNIFTAAGLHITGGNATGLGGSEPWLGDVGGGIYMDARGSSRLQNNHLYGNTAQSGGGGFLVGGAILDGNTISSNTAERQGGGILLLHGSNQLSNNIFTGNDAAWGAGLKVNWATLILIGNTFRSNTSPELGGGLFIEAGSAELSDNIFVANTAERGGGLAILRSQEVTLVNNVIADNQASIEGTGIYIYGTDPMYVLHTTLVGNTGGDGSGIAISGYNPWGETKTSTVDLWDTIVASQTIGLNVIDGSSMAVDSILWHSVAITLTEVPEADVSLVNQLYGDPVFADPTNGDYHITGASAARDVGMNAGVHHDLDGQVRKMGFGFDPGAYEYPDAALSLYMAPERIGVNVGDELVYTIIMTSSGMLDASNVVLTDTLDTWQRATAVDSADGNCTIEDPGWGGTVVCSPGDLNIGEVIEIALTAQVSTTTPLGQAMINTLSTIAVETDKNLETLPVYAQECLVRIGNSPTTYTSVQAAVDAAYPTALIKVAGTCMGVYGPEGWRQQVFIDQPLTLQGGYTTSNWITPDPETNITTLDARGQGRVFYILGDSGLNTITIDGFDITGGNAYGQIGDHDPNDKNGSSGGGIYIYGGNEQIMLSNNHIYNNIANGGGGLTTSFCSGTQLINDTFTGNYAGSGGGGYYLHAGGANLTDVIFDSNITAGDGGGIDVIAGNAKIVRSIFISNQAGGIGGAMRAEMGWDISESLLLSNTAKYGGGIGISDFTNWSTYTSIINTVIADNLASQEGSGIFIPSGQSLHLLHTTLARNTGGDGGGVTLGWYDWMSPGTSTLLMTDTIMSYQDVGIRVIDTSNVTVNGVLWFATSENVWQSMGQP